MVRIILIICGFISLAMAVAGIFLPLLPTVPLVLLAAFCFARSSDRFHKWLTGSRYFGPIIRDWEESKSISVKAKITSVATVILSMGISIFLLRHLWLRAILLTIAVLVIGYIVSLPVKQTDK